VVKKFSDNDVRTAPYHALQIWQILICKAANRQTMTYGELAEILGFKGAQVLGSFLEYILRYCAKNDLPSLTVLVVNQTTGLPGAGFPQENLHSERERVFRFKWFGLLPPTPAEFSATARRKKEG
jgi:putative restriction endonuclease